MEQRFCYKTYKCYAPVEKASHKIYFPFGGGVKLYECNNIKTYTTEWRRNLAKLLLHIIFTRGKQKETLLPISKANSRGIIN